MKTYTAYNLYCNNTSASLKDQCILKNGFNIYAFLFGAAWLLSKKLWLLCFVIISSWFLFDILIERAIIDENILISWQFIIAIYLGYSGNDWLGCKLVDDGYVLTSIVAANSIEEARLKLIYTDNASHTQATNTLSSVVSNGDK